MTTTSPLLLAIDQGTTSSRAIAFNLQGHKVAVAQKEFSQHYPRDGWVEHAPEDIWSTTLTTARQVIEKVSSAGHHIVSIGITNQRETTLIWDRNTGKPIHNAIVWQDRRTADTCARLKQKGVEEDVRRKTGLVLDPYFSATKIAYILDHVDGARALAEQGKLAFGTVDTWLLWNLTGGKVHATDATNASRTSLYNIQNGEWDHELLELFRIPPSILPKVKDSAADYGVTAPSLFGHSIPIGGIAGDQQAAALGQACLSPGDIKSTYGTGCFILAHTGDYPVFSQNGLLTTVASQLNGKRSYAVEGSIFVTGAGIQWLRDMLGFIESAAETEDLAKSVQSTNGVYVVPAFAGLGAPYWKPDARGMITGLSRGSTKAEIVRAMLESVAYQTDDLLSALKDDGINVQQMKVDGGMTANDWLCQFMSNICALPLHRPQNLETTALGAAALAGIQASVIDGVDGLRSLTTDAQIFTPSMGIEQRAHHKAGWQHAIKQVLSTAG